MDNKNHDKVFFINFSVVLGILGGIALIIGAIARFVAPAVEAAGPEQVAALTQRVQPLTHVVTDPEELAKLTAVSSRPPMAGDEVVAKICSSCHGAGVLGAPKIGDAAAWGARKASEGGLDGLTAAAIKGKNSMPPRGGDPTLSDDEMKAAVKILSGA